MFRGRFPCLLSVFNASCGVGGHQENEFLAQRCLQIMSFQYQLLAAFQHLVLVCFTLNFILGTLVLKKIIMLQIFFLLYFIYQFLAFSTEDCIGIQRGMYHLTLKLIHLTSLNIPCGSPSRRFYCTSLGFTQCQKNR